MKRRVLKSAALRRAKAWELLADYERLKSTNTAGFTAAGQRSVSQQLKELRDELTYRRKEAAKVVEQVNSVLGIDEPDLPLALLALEHGFKGHEGGHNLEQTRAMFLKVFKGEG